MPESLFNKIGISGTSFLLIIAGVIMTQIERIHWWGGLCISLGICVLFFILSSKTKGTTKTIANVVGLCALVAAIICLLIAV